jgi:hypothetical protein
LRDAASCRGGQECELHEWGDMGPGSTVEAGVSMLRWLVCILVVFYYYYDFLPFSLIARKKKQRIVISSTFRKRRTGKHIRNG